MSITCTVNVMSEMPAWRKAIKAVMDALKPLQYIGALVDFNFRRREAPLPQANGQRPSSKSKRKARATR